MTAKRKNLLENNKIIKILITAVFLLFPIIDILRSTNIKNIEIFNISIIEFINFLLIYTHLHLASEHLYL